MSDPQIVKFLGKNPIAGNTIFHEAAEAGSVPVLKRVREVIDEPYYSIINDLNSHGITCMHVAVKLHRGLHAIEVLEELVQMGANLNAPDNISESTVLHETVWYEDFELATWLCHYPQINLEARRRDGLTAYQMAYLEQNKRMMSIFQAAGANCQPPSDPRDSPSSMDSVN